MAVQDNGPLQLLCTYWGGDSGREFDILLDGQTIAMQQLQNEKPGQFIDKYYTVPPGLIKGRTGVTVMFKAKPGSTAGGLFGCRMLKAAQPEKQLWQ